MRMQPYQRRAVSQLFAGLEQGQASETASPCHRPGVALPGPRPQAAVSNPFPPAAWRTQYPGAPQAPTCSTVSDTISMVTVSPSCTPVASPNRRHPWIMYSYFSCRGGPGAGRARRVRKWAAVEKGDCL